MGEDEVGGQSEAPRVEVKGLKNLVEEHRMDIVDKESHLDQLQKKNDKLSSSLSKAKDEVINEFKVSDVYTNLLDKNYATGFENFRQDAREAFLGVDFDSIKLCITAESSLLLGSSKDIDVDDDATTSNLPKHDALPVDNALSDLSK